MNANPFFGEGLFFGQRMRFFAANTTGMPFLIPKCPAGSPGGALEQNQFQVPTGCGTAEAADS